MSDGERRPAGLIESTICQEAAEPNEGDYLLLERPANVADCLDGFHVSFRQSEIAQILLWQVRSLFETAKQRRTGRSLTKA